MAQVDPILQNLMNAPDEEQMLIAQLLNPQAQQQRMGGVSDLFDLSGVTAQPAAPKPKAAAKKPTALPKKTPAVVVPAPETQGQLMEQTPAPQFTLEQALSSEAFQPPEQPVGNGPISPEGRQYAEDFLEMQTPGMRQYRGTLDDVGKMISGYDPNIPDYNLSSILGASDILTGSKFMDKYQTPKQQKQAADINKINMLMGLAKEQGGLAGAEEKLLGTYVTSDIRRMLGEKGIDVKTVVEGMRNEAAGTRLDKSLAFKDRELEMRDKWEQLKAKAKAARGPAQTEALKTLEREFTKTYYNKWKAGGGYGGFNKNMANIDSALQVLSTNAHLMGKDRYRVLPEKLWPTELRTARKQIVDAIASTIKQRGVDSQFAQKEAEQIWQRAFDPSLSAEENIRSLTNEKLLLQSENDEINRTGQYLESHGMSLKGFVGSEASYGAPTAPKTQKAAPKGGMTDAQRARLQELRAKVGK